MRDSVATLVVAVVTLQLLATLDSCNRPAVAAFAAVLALRLAWGYASPPCPCILQRSPCSDRKGSLMTRDNLRWLEQLPVGWHLLYRDLTTALAEIGPDIVVSQAKQKLGSLRVDLKKSEPRA